ncbi:TPA: glycosyltransferase family 4 protein, partial [Escherichia coli]|nr:glycosyltransferase family 4 protein [Escherichia coli]
NGALVSELKKKNVPVHIVPSLVREINPIKDSMAIFSIRKLIKNIRPNIISLHSSKAGIIGRFAAIGTNIPVLFTAHGWAFANGVGKKQQKLYCAIERFMTPFARKIITVSQQDKDLAVKYGVASSDKQIVIHNGMPDIDVSSLLKRDVASTSVNLISVARFSEQKDHKTLFLALKDIDDLEWRIQLIGKGPLLGYYKEFATKLGISDRVQFLGERHDVAQLLHQSDVFLLISNWEGFPRSILEAMRAGIPVIASDVGGSSESVADNHTGFLIPRGDVDALQQALRLLMQSKILREKMGANGRERYLSNF